MRNSDKEQYLDFKNKLIAYGAKVSMPGIYNSGALECLVLQFIDSFRRVKYIATISDRVNSDYYCNTLYSSFDPLKGAVWFKKNRNYDEAMWLTFLSTHFGKNLHSGWNLTRGVYGALGAKNLKWTWETVNNDFDRFRNWLHNNQEKIKKTGNFGNHRKYQSIDAMKPTGTGNAVGSYIEWYNSFNNYNGLMTFLKNDSSNNPRDGFQKLYTSLSSVVSFGRTAKFDFLTMLGKLKILNIEPDSTYMDGATGPKLGTKLLFFGTKNFSVTNTDLEQIINDFELHLNYPFGMQIIEDALCNWQKSPNKYIHFRG